MPGDDAIEFTLLENGLDFIWSAVEHLHAGSSKRELKYAVLHLGAGIELVLKERLRREDWRLLFTDPDKASEEAYRSGSFVSVRFDDCLSRLATECFVQITNEQKTRLRAVREKRNRLEHLALVDSAAAIVAVAAEALAVLIDVVPGELPAEPPFGAEESLLLRKIQAKLPDLDAFVRARAETIKPRLELADAVLPCPVCLQDALTLDIGVRCLFCGYTDSAEGAAEAYTTEVLGVSRHSVRKEGGNWPIRGCPACDGETCVDTDEGFVCFGCGGRWQVGTLQQCSDCARWIYSDSDLPMCNHCFLWRMNRGD